MPTAATRFSPGQAARVLGLPPSRVRSWTRRGPLRPVRGPDGERLLSFQDLAVLRAGQALVEADVPVRRVHAALTRVRELLPAGTSLSAVGLAALGGRVLVRHADRLWDPHTGQLELPLSRDGRGSRPLPGVRRLDAEGARRGPARRTSRGTAGDARAWLQWGRELEDADPAAARRAYRRALELDPRLADAYARLGRLLHEVGAWDEAELQYRAALAVEGGHSRAWFRLGVLLEDRDRPDGALEAYRRALDADPAMAPAHRNAARLQEGAERHGEARRHGVAHARLTAEPREPDPER